MTLEAAMPGTSSGSPGPGSRPPTRGYSATKDQHLARLTRIKDEMRHGQHMMDNDDSCMDVVAQICVIQAALDELALRLLADHAHRCIIEAETAEQVDKTDELMSAIGRLVRRDRDEVPTGSPEQL